MHAINQNEQKFRELKARYDPVFEQLLEKICTYNAHPNQDLLRRAYEFALWAHRDEHRFSGEPYFDHCINVALILADMRMDSVTIAAGLLHDVVEDTGFTVEDIEEAFGKQIAQIVNGVTKISEISGRKNVSYELRQAETFRKMLLSLANDVRVILVKFADRLHNMRTLQHVPASKRLRIALETRDVYAPLAHRFGMAQLKSELEDLAFKFIDNKAYTDLVRQLNRKKAEREAYIQEIIKPIKEELASHNIQAEISGRPKHLYSIYRKMKLRGKSLEEIYDLFAIRIIVNRVEECYYVLGLVHNLFTPVYERFKDYIATPKSNNYQSLHTTVMDRRGHMVEIQIRTWDMHRVAEMGIAAHWKYKEGKAETYQDEVEQQLAWVRQFLEEYKESGVSDAHEFLESLKINLYQDEVFVFTPKGDVIRLPLGATPVDFAFAIHTNIGMHCIGAKVNGRIVPLKYELKSGDLVEIITSANQHPHQDWLSFVKTSKARHHIRKYLREVQFEHSVKLGEEILTKYLKRYRMKVTDEELEAVATRLHFEDLRNLKAAIGRGEVSIEKVFSSISREQPEENRESFLKRIVRRSRKHSAIQVEGIDNMVIHIGKCCQPVPGDDIIGYITRGKGITIHRVNCPNMQSLVERRDRTVQVNWTVEAEEEFKVQLSLLGEDRKNLIRDITQAIANSNTNILHLELKAKDRLAVGKIIIEVKNLPHLTRVINAISKVRGMISVERVEAPVRKRRRVNQSKGK
ncbi:MAG: bifunctional (p)ppGpp synthetase/guanosine-3',5'-bis(diphosphate) 3'-pyrophosphohydrolase [Calditrichaeota bacterium]|nr:MAG: bifunctional (p)ppGpp synthetase/guanosine-3',5'-bis(diphosphate) 3'-pyrophosphohydrolase [Calditrichota bacterium]